MVLIQTVRDWALSFEETEEKPHFENTSFRVKKKIFATLNEKENRVTLKLSEIDQSVFSDPEKQVIFPVPNKWGKQGWTHVQLDLVHPDLFKDALTVAYCAVAPPKLADKYRTDGL